jgi:hypothetical protein
MKVHETIKQDFIQPHRYKDILDTIWDNVPNIHFIDGKNTIQIKKKDMIFEVTHPEEVSELMTYIFNINNFICRQYRRRKHILKSTEIIDE